MPRTKIRVISLLRKSQDVALLAVEIYNKPRTTFRSAGFIVLMNIAWTSLFHAIFEKRNVKYFHKRNKVRYEKVDGERKAWELAVCIKKFYGSNITPERKNLDFFIKLRDKIEHRFLPEIDDEIFGECQAMLINYETLMVQEFGDEQAIKQNLVFALQFSKILHSGQVEVIKIRQTDDYRKVKRFIHSYRSRLKKDILNSLNYNFRVYLVPKVGNHRSSSDFALEFVKYDLSNPQEADRYKKFLVAIRDKQVPLEGFRAGDVAKKVYTALKDVMPTGWKFTASSHHVRCWKYYRVRSATGDPNPENTNSKYCFYDKTFGQYGFTQDWVALLIKNLKNKDEYRKIMQTK